MGTKNLRALKRGETIYCRDTRSPRLFPPPAGDVIASAIPEFVVADRASDLSLRPARGVITARWPEVVRESHGAGAALRYGRWTGERSLATSR